MSNNVNNITITLYNFIWQSMWLRKYDTHLPIIKTPIALWQPMIMDFLDINIYQIIVYKILRSYISLTVLDKMNKVRMLNQHGVVISPFIRCMIIVESMFYSYSSLTIYFYTFVSIMLILDIIRNISFLWSFMYTA